MLLFLNLCCVCSSYEDSRTRWSIRLYTRKAGGTVPEGTVHEMIESCKMLEVVRMLTLLQLPITLSVRLDPPYMATNDKRYDNNPEARFESTNPAITIRTTWNNSIFRS